MNPARFVFLPLLLAGCTSVGLEHNASAPPGIPPPAPIPNAPPVTTTAFTPYSVAPYRDAEDAALVHAAHTLYRRTVVPASFDSWLATAPRESFGPASCAPLPPSTELAAELATQRTVTAELKALQESMKETGRKMQEQYRVLVRESTNTKALREQLAAERLPASSGAVAAVPPLPSAEPGQPTDNEN